MEKAASVPVSVPHDIQTDKECSVIGSSQKSEKTPLIPTEVKPKRLFISLGRPSQWSWRKLYIVTTLWIAYIFVSAAYSIIGPFFPNEAEAKGSTPTITGLIVSCSPLCVVLFSPLFGYYLPRLGLRFILLLGLFLVGGAFVLLGFAADLPSGWVFILFCILLRMVEGTGTAMYATAMFTLLPELYPTSVGTIMGLMEVAGGLGFSVGPPIGGFLYAIGGFRIPFIVVGAICLGFLVPIFLMVRQTSCSKQTLSLKTLAKLICNFVIVLLIFANMLSLAGLAFFTPTLSPFLIDQFGLSEEQIGLVFLSGPVPYMLASLVVGRLTDKLGPRYFIIVGFLLSGIGYFLVGPADFIAKPALWISIVGFIVIGLGASLGIVPVYSDILEIGMAMNIGEDNEALTAVVSGVSSATLSLGEFAGPLIGGVLTEVMDFQTSAVVFGEVFFAEGFLLLGATLIDRFYRSRTCT